MKASAEGKKIRLQLHCLQLADIKHIRHIHNGESGNR